MSKFLWCTFGLVLSSSVLAAEWTEPRTILGIETTANDIQIRIEGHSSADACSKITENGVNLTFAKIPVEMGNRDALVSLVYMAYAAEKKINMYCDTVTSWSQVNHIKVEDF